MYKKAIIVITLILVSALLLTACAGAPELQLGERYFEGDVDFDLAESCTVSYVLSADGKSVRDVRVFMEKYAFKTVYKEGFRSVNINEKVNQKTLLLGKGTPDGQGYLEIRSVEATLRFNFTDAGVSGEMDYTYESDSDEDFDFKIFIGTYPFVMEDRTDSLESE